MLISASRNSKSKPVRIWRKPLKRFLPITAGPMKGLILDLRNDPGGLLNGAVAVSAAFLPENALVVIPKGAVLMQK
jgi:C-terminal processing protease CtpA/Prc